jgi:branched-subunit amino acid ABC-type transport system permease component
MGVDVGGMGVIVGGMGVNVGNIGKGMDAGVIGVEAGAHPFSETVMKTNTRNVDLIEFFMILFVILCRTRFICL